MLLRATGLCKSFGGVRAVHGVDLEVSEGSIVGLIGPNGAGKTTLFALLAGEYRPDAGRIIFNGRDITGWPPSRVCAAGLARTFQIVRPFPTLTTYENILVGAYAAASSEPAARRIADDAMAFVGLSPYHSTPARDLTLSARKRLEVARALATKPKLLLLDEVFAGLTPVELQAALQLVAQIAARGMTLVLIEHVMQVVMSLSQHVVVLDHGEELASGSPQEVARNPAVIEAYLGEEYLLHAET